MVAVPDAIIGFGYCEGSENESTDTLGDLNSISPSTSTSRQNAGREEINCSTNNNSTEDIISSINNNKELDRSNINSNTEKSTYKEVVIIGNGPSGIILSYFLAGNWPYYNGTGEGVNEMLHYRLLSSSEGYGGIDNIIPVSGETWHFDYIKYTTFS
jgi:hypothetical protein